MKAIQIKQYGDNSELQLNDIPVPQPADQQVLVQLKASSVNPVDYKIRSGFFSKQMQRTFPFTLGWEGAGVVKQVGAEVSNFQEGDEVMIMPNFMQGGTYAEYVVVNKNEVTKKPSYLSFTQASVLPFSLGTAYTALILDANIQSGQKLLIHGAGGAVGQMAVQIAINKGLHATGTATGDNIQELKNLGIDAVIDYATTDFTTEVKDLDVILDLVGGATLANSYDLLRKGGIIVSTAQPPDAEKLATLGLKGKMTMTTPQMFSEIFSFLETEKIKVKAPQILSLDKAQEALESVENRKAKTKIVFEF